MCQALKIRIMLQIFSCSINWYIDLTEKLYVVPLFLYWTWTIYKQWTWGHGRVNRCEPFRQVQGLRLWFCRLASQTSASRGYPHVRAKAKHSHALPRPAPNTCTSLCQYSGATTSDLCFGWISVNYEHPKLYLGGPLHLMKPLHLPTVYLNYNQPMGKPYQQEKIYWLHDSILPFFCCFVAARCCAFCLLAYSDFVEQRSIFFCLWSRFAFAKLLLQFLRCNSETCFAEWYIFGECHRWQCSQADDDEEEDDDDMDDNGDSKSNSCNNNIKNKVTVITITMVTKHRRLTSEILQSLFLPRF